MVHAIAAYTLTQYDVINGITKPGSVFTSDAGHALAVISHGTGIGHYVYRLTSDRTDIDRREYGPVADVECILNFLRSRCTINEPDPTPSPVGIVYTAFDTKHGARLFDTTSGTILPGPVHVDTCRAVNRIKDARGNGYARRALTDCIDIPTVTVPTPEQQSVSYRGHLVANYRNAGDELTAANLHLDDNWNDRDARLAHIQAYDAWKVAERELGAYDLETEGTGLTICQGSYSPHAQRFIHCGRMIPAGATLCDACDTRTIPHVIRDQETRLASMPAIAGGSPDHKPEPAKKQRKQANRATSQAKDNDRAERDQQREAYRLAAENDAPAVAAILTDLGFTVASTHESGDTPVTIWHDADGLATIKQTPYTLKFYNGRPAKLRKSADSEFVKTVEYGWQPRGERAGYVAGVAEAFAAWIQYDETAGGYGYLDTGEPSPAVDPTLERIDLGDFPTYDAAYSAAKAEYDRLDNPYLVVTAGTIEPGGHRHLVPVGNGDTRKMLEEYDPAHRLNLEESRRLVNVGIAAYNDAANNDPKWATNEHDREACKQAAHAARLAEYAAITGGDQPDPEPPANAYTIATDAGTIIAQVSHIDMSDTEPAKDEPRDLMALAHEHAEYLQRLTGSTVTFKNAPRTPGSYWIMVNGEPSDRRARDAQQLVKHLCKTIEQVIEHKRNATVGDLLTVTASGETKPVTVSHAGPWQADPWSQYPPISGGSQDHTPEPDGSFLDDYLAAQGCRITTSEQIKEEERKAWADAAEAYKQRFGTPEPESDEEGETNVQPIDVLQAFSGIDGTTRYKITDDTTPAGQIARAMVDALGDDYGKRLGALDWCYQAIHDALADAIDTETETGDQLNEAAYELADSLTDVYNSGLRAWMQQHSDVFDYELDYLDDAHTVTDSGDFYRLLMATQCNAYIRAFQAVAAHWPTA